MAYETGTVQLQTSEKTYHLRFSTNALCVLEDAFGKSAIEIGQDLASETGISVRAFRTVFWCALQDHHKEMTEAQAGELMDKAGFDLVGAKVGAAFQAAFPDSGEGTSEGKPAAERGQKT